MTKSSKSELPAYLKFKDFVERSGLSEGMINRLIREGRLPAYNENGIRYIAASDLSRLGDIMGRAPVKAKTTNVEWPDVF